MAMRGPGQIRELCEIAEPDVAAITNVGPVHLELLGTLEAIAEAKAEILSGLGPDGRAVVPADAEALEPHLRDDRSRRSPSAPAATCSRCARAERARRAGSTEAAIDPRRRGEFELPFTEAHNLANALAAVAIGVALGVPARRDGASGAADILLAPARRAGRAGRRNRARQRLLQRQPDLDARGARPPRVAPVGGAPVAVLGEMAELGPDGARLPPRDRRARARGSGSTCSSASASWPATTRPTTGSPDAAARAAVVVAGLLEPGDAVLVKGSRSVGLEVVTDGAGGEGARRRDRRRRRSRQASSLEARSTAARS